MRLIGFSADKPYELDAHLHAHLTVISGIGGERRAWLAGALADALAGSSTPLTGTAEVGGAVVGLDHPDVARTALGVDPILRRADLLADGFEALLPEEPALPPEPEPVPEPPRPPAPVLPAPPVVQGDPPRPAVADLPEPVVPEPPAPLQLPPLVVPPRPPDPAVVAGREPVPPAPPEPVPDPPRPAVLEGPRPDLPPDLEVPPPGPLVLPELRLPDPPPHPDAVAGPAPVPPAPPEPVPDPPRPAVLRRPRPDLPAGAEVPPVPTPPPAGPLVLPEPPAGPGAAGGPPPVAPPTPRPVADPPRPGILDEEPPDDELDLSAAGPEPVAPTPPGELPEPERPAILDEEPPPDPGPPPGAGAAAAAETLDALDRLLGVLGDELADREQQLAALEREIEVVAVSLPAEPTPVREALAAVRRAATADVGGERSRAAALAAEWAAIGAELAELVSDSAPAWLVESSRQARDDARRRLAEAEAQMAASGGRHDDLDMARVAELEQVHGEVLALEARATRTSFSARRQLADARAREAALLARLGVTSYEGVALRIATAQRLAGMSTRLEHARAALADAEAMWAELRPGPDDPRIVALAGRKAAVAAEAAALLGFDPGDELPSALAGFEPSAPDTTPARQALADALGLAGAGRFSADDPGLEAAAAAWLDGADRRAHDAEAALARRAALGQARDEAAAALGAVRARLEEAGEARRQAAAAVEPDPGDVARWEAARAERQRWIEARAGAERSWAAAVEAVAAERGRRAAAHAVARAAYDQAHARWTEAVERLRAQQRAEQRGRLDRWRQARDGALAEWRAAVEAAESERARRAADHADAVRRYDEDRRDWEAGRQAAGAEAAWRAEVERLTAEHEAARAAAEAEHGRRLAARAEALDAAEWHRAEADWAAARAEAEAERTRRLAEHEAARARYAADVEAREVRLEEARRAAAAHTEEVERLRRDHDELVARIRGEHRRRAAEHDAAVAAAGWHEAERAWQVEVERAEAERRRRQDAHDRARAGYEAAAAAWRHRYDEASAALAAWEDEVARRRSDHEEEVERLTAAHRRLVAEREAAVEAALDLRARRGEALAAWQEEVARRREEDARAVAAWEAEIADAKGRHADLLAGWEAARRAAVEDLERRRRLWEDEVAQLRHRQDQARLEAAAHGAELEVVLLARVAAHRSSGPGGSVPLVVDDALAGLPPSLVDRLLQLLLRVSAALQVVYLTDDPHVVGWAASLAPEQGRLLRLGRAARV